MRYSLKTLFITLTAFGVVVAMGIVGYQSYLTYKFRQGIAPAWAEAPVTSSLVEIEEINDIVLGFDGDELTVIDGGNLNKQDNGNYDLDCSAGKFRVIYYDDIYRDVTNEITSTESSFEVIRDSLMITENSPISSAPLWVLRAQFMPMGCNDRLQHFESEAKMGFVSGRINNRPNTVLFVFDKSGYFSIGVLLLEPNIDTWDQLAARIKLVAVGNGR